MGKAPRRPRCSYRFLLPPRPPSAAAALAPLEEEGHGHAPREVQPRDVPSHPRGAQVDVDHHGDREVVVVVVTAVVATAGRRGRQRRFHRPSDEPLHFFAARGLMRNVRRSPVRNSLRSLVAAASPPPPPPPPPTTTTRAVSTPRGIFRRAAVYAAISSSTIQPTDQPTNFAICATDFSVTVVQIFDT